MPLAVLRPDEQQPASDRRPARAVLAHAAGTCTPLWHGNGGSFYVPSGPVVAGGELWATGGPQNGPAKLYAFGLPVPGAARAATAARAGGRPGQV